MPPAISVLTAVHDPDRSHLEACLASVASQTLGDWEHVIVDDGSTEAYVDEVLRAAETDPRVRVVRRSGSGGIVAASRDALASAQGDLIALLDHDDVLAPDALERMVAALADGADLAYSDHDLLTVEGHLTRPSFKPDFSPEQLRNQNYVLHLVVARRSLVESVGGFRTGFDGAQDHDLLLRISEVTDRIVHVPHVLYHWRQAGTSVAADPSAKPWAYDAGCRAVQEHCDRVGIDAVVEPGAVPGSYRVNRSLDSPPRVSVIIPTRGSSRRVWGITRCFVTEAVRSMVEHSTYPDLEFVVVHDLETPPSVLRYLELIAGDRLLLVEFPHPFNFSEKINVGAQASSGELLLVLNDDTELIVPDSVEVMAAHLLDDSVGMVGPKLLFADGTVQDGGHIYNEHVLPGLVGWHGTSPGPGQLRPLVVDREVSGVTAAAAMLRRTVFDEIDGFDPILWMNFNDVDLSLKVRRTGRRVIWTPHASWYHFESQTRPPSAEPEEFVEIDRRWHDEINRDPYYNPNFVTRRTDWLERPWHSGFPPLDDVDTTVSHRSWLWERISETPWVDRLLSTQARSLVLVTGLVAASWFVASTLGADPGAARRLLFTAIPLVTWSVLTSVVVFRRREVLASALAIGAAPSVVGALAVGSGTALAWSFGLVVGLLLGPLWRRSHAVAILVSALGLAGLVASAINGGDRDVDGGSPAGFVHDAVALFGDRNGWLAGITVAVWWATLIALIVYLAVMGRRVGAAAVLATSVALVALSAAVPSFAASVASLGIVTSVTIAVAARVDEGVRGSTRLLNGVSVAVVLTWLLTAIDAVGIS